MGESLPLPWVFWGKEAESAREWERVSHSRRSLQIERRLATKEGQRRPKASLCTRGPGVYPSAINIAHFTKRILHSYVDKYCSLGHNGYAEKGGIALSKIANDLEYKERVIDTVIESFLQVSGAICIEGPKWCGKTWTSSHHSNSEYLVVSPDNNFSNRQLAELNPTLVFG